MGSLPTVVCVKKVKQSAAEEWDESMPLPGDIIEGIAEDGSSHVADDDSFVSAKAKSELNLHLGRLNRVAEYVWLKVRRGDSTVKLRVCVVPDKSLKLQKKYTVRASSDERHVAVLADMTFEECFELQELSRRVVNLDFKGYRKKGIKYDWKLKVGMYLPDQHSTIVSSILFMALPRERCAQPLTVRAMAWFSAAVSCGIPLVFVSLQTEQIITAERGEGTSKDIVWSTQENSHTRGVLNIEQGIRLWFLPGVAELLYELTPQPGETRFGMDIKRNEEGFICVYSVSKDTAAERAGLGDLFEHAHESEHLLVISRLQGKSLMPSMVDSEGLIHCCDNIDIKETLFSAMEKSECIKLHIMSWPNRVAASEPPPPQPLLPPPPTLSAANLRPPDVHGF